MKLISKLLHNFEEIAKDGIQLLIPIIRSDVFV